MTQDALATVAASLARREELGVEDVIAQVQKIQAVMAKVMKEGEHYGVIPGTGTKPSLLKPGAEKLLLTFRFDPEYEATETYDGKHLTIVSRCTLYHITSGQRMGSGMGSCSTKESKYAYRYAARKCPTCGKEAIIKGKEEYGGGWVCFKKKDGCGAKFKDGDAAIESQETGRVPNEDLADQYNTVLKMANKRSLVAAVLNVTAASDIFTQDLEDNHEHGGAVREAAASRDSAGNVASTTAASSAPSNPDAPTLITESKVLFPTPEDDERKALMKTIDAIRPPSRLKVLKQRLLGDAEADLTKRDISELKLIANQARA